jgi:hypothetical protein
MLHQESATQRFLIEFTKEILLHLKKELVEKEIIQQEELRAKKAVEIEKLKEKFLSYSQVSQPKKEISNKIFQIIQEPNTKFPTQLTKKPEIPKKEIPPKPIIVQKPIMRQVIKQPEIQVKKEIIKEELKPQEIKKDFSEMMPSIMGPPKTTTEINKIETQKIQEQEIKIQTPKVIQEVKKPQTTPVETAISGILEEYGINFGKLNTFALNHLITSIECAGENKQIIIKRAGNTIKTGITLTREEIQEIIKSFSERAKIPLIEGMLNARVNDLEISAVISETVSPSFFIKRIIVQILPTGPSTLEKPMMQFNPEKLPKLNPPMPPINRPFTAR